MIAEVQTEIPPRSNPVKLIGLFVGVTAAVFAFSLLNNANHLGVNAAIHWDARTAVCSADPMPDKSQLMDARGHVFDAAHGCTDPRAATYYFNYPTDANAHVPLETVRKYYAQVATAIARRAYEVGLRRTGSATGGILFFQLSAGIAMAVSLGILTTIGVAGGPTGGGGIWKWPLSAAFLAAVAGEPVMLSLSRQMLTEPAGFLFLAGAWGTVAWFYRPGTSTPVRIVLAAAGAGLFFLTVRSRYSLAVPAVVITPLVILSNASLDDLRRRWRSWSGSVAVMALVIAGLVVRDVHRYGPFIFPWEYQRLLVQSTRLYFHVEPPFDSFWTALYVNAPLLVLPVVVVGAGVIGAGVIGCRPLGPLRQNWRSMGRRETVLGYSAVAMVVLLYPLAKTAAQQVGYQPRHLFPFSAGFVSIGLLALPWVRWRPATAVPVFLICLAVIAANTASTTGPQRTTMAREFPPVFSALMRDRSNPGPHPRLWKDLLAGYFDWADNRRLHDSLAVLQFVRDHPGSNGTKALLIVDESTEGGWWVRQAAADTGQPVGYWREDSPAVRGETDGQVRAAISAGVPVFFAHSRSAGLKNFPFPRRQTPLILDITDLDTTTP